MAEQQDSRTLANKGSWIQSNNGANTIQIKLSTFQSNDQQEEQRLKQHLTQDHQFSILTKKTKEEEEAYLEDSRITMDESWLKGWKNTLTNHSSNFDGSTMKKRKKRRREGKKRGNQNNPKEAQKP